MSMRMHIPREGYEKLMPAKARIIAHLIGDGAHYKTKTDYVMKYEVKDIQSLSQFFDDMISVYGIEPKIEINKSGITGKPMLFVRLRSKLVYTDLLRYATYFSKDWHIKATFLRSSCAIKTEFLKALFDDEASVVNKKIFLYSINNHGLHQIQEILKEFTIESYIQSGYGAKRNVYAVVIRDLIGFKRKIGFGLKRKADRLRDFI
jgi:hypothetical protein